MPDLIQIKRALLSVSDKRDLVPFAKALVSRGAEIVSTGGTARALKEAGIDVIPIDSVTEFPEMMGGRVKTLHPRVHGALLAVRDEPDHAQALEEHAITPIDLICVNLYPFERTVSAPGVEQREAIEQIDIGGPSMLRSGAKNFEYVTVVTAPSQYDKLINEIDKNDGATTRRTRAQFAGAAFARTAEYDAAIATYLNRRSPAAFPDTLRVNYVKAADLRYGENPHQDAALYRDPASTGPTVVGATQLHGKVLSYNNIADAASALELAKDLRRLDDELVGATVIKHNNACGAAVSKTGAGAVRAAIDADPIAAYGGIMAVNRAIDRAAAEAICDEGNFLEVIIAASFDDDALALLKDKWVNVRLLATGEREGSSARKLAYKSVPGGMLVQDRDTRTAAIEQWEHAAGPAPSEDALAAAAVVWTIVKHQTSNAIAIGGVDKGMNGVRLFGAGVGQVDRVGACRSAVSKSGDHAHGAIAASDAFFPFADGPQVLIDAGISMIVHPGGSKRDSETFEVCETRGVTCMTTGVRHFRH